MSPGVEAPLYRSPFGGLWIVFVWAADLLHEEKSAEPPAPAPAPQKDPGLRERGQAALARAKRAFGAALHELHRSD